MIPTLATFALLSIWALAVPARAAQIAVDFTGTVESYYRSVALDDSVGVGSLVSGSFSIDADSPDLDGSGTPGYSYYAMAQPPSSFTLDVGNYHFVSNEILSVNVTDAVDPSQMDSVGIDSLAADGDVATQLFLLLTGDYSVLSSTALAAIPFDLSLWTNEHAMSANFEHPAGMAISLDSLQVTAPEPAPFALLALGLAAVALARRGRA